MTSKEWMAWHITHSPEKFEEQTWWRANILPLKTWERATDFAKQDWHADAKLATLLDWCRKRSTLRAELAVLWAAGGVDVEDRLHKYLNGSGIWLYGVRLVVDVDNPVVPCVFNRAGVQQFIQRLAHFACHVSVGTEPHTPGPAMHTKITLPT
jgi:hypothetical protein